MPRGRFKELLFSTLFITIGKTANLFYNDKLHFRLLMTDCETLANKNVYYDVTECILDYMLMLFLWY